MKDQVIVQSAHLHRQYMSEILFTETTDQFSTGYSLKYGII